MRAVTALLACFVLGRAGGCVRQTAITPEKIDPLFADRAIDHFYTVGSWSRIARTRCCVHV